MGLYTDSDVVTEEMLLAEDPEAAAIVAAEGVSMPTAILTAWDTVSAHLAEWLDGQTGGGYGDAVLAAHGARSRWDIGCVVASSLFRGQKSAIERAVIWRALESLYRSAYAPNGAGADPDVIKAAYGEVYNLRTLSITSTGATVYYTAPDATNACSVEYGTSATPGTGTRVTDTATSRFRSKALTGLSTGTLYHFRVYCGQMTASSFTTL